MELPNGKNKKEWLFKRLRKLTDKEKSLFLKLSLCLAAGIVLMTISSGGKTTSPQAKEATAEPLFLDYYSEEVALEEKLVAIFSAVKDAGKVSVALTFEEGTESIFAEESNETLSENESETSSALAEINDTPVLIKQRLPKVRGLVIVAQGAGNPLVKERLYEAASSLLGLTSAQIAIIEGDLAL